MLVCPHIGGSAVDVAWGERTPRRRPADQTRRNVGRSRESTRTRTKPVPQLEVDGPVHRTTEGRGFRADAPGGRPVRDFRRRRTCTLGAGGGRPRARLGGPVRRVTAGLRMGSSVVVGCFGCLTDLATFDLDAKQRLFVDGEEKKGPFEWTCSRSGGAGIPPEGARAAPAARSGSVRRAQGPVPFAARPPADPAQTAFLTIGAAGGAGRARGAPAGEIIGAGGPVPPSLTPHGEAAGSYFSPLHERECPDLSYPVAVTVEKPAARSAAVRPP